MVKAKPKAQPKTKAAAKKRTKVRAKTKQPPKLKRWKAAELKPFREQLLQERERLLAELREVEKRTAQAVASERASDISGDQDHPADLASVTFERQKDLAFEENIQNLLNRIDSALAKIKQKTYGFCDICGRRIGKERLRALPFATLCLSCQSDLERR